MSFGMRLLALGFASTIFFMLSKGLGAEIGNTARLHL